MSLHPSHRLSRQYVGQRTYTRTAAGHADMQMRNTAPSWPPPNQTHGLGNTDRVARHQASLHSICVAGSTAEPDCNLFTKLIEVACQRALIDVWVPIIRHRAYLRYSTAQTGCGKGCPRRAAQRPIDTVREAVIPYPPTSLTLQPRRIQSVLSDDTEAGSRDQGTMQPKAQFNFSPDAWAKKPSESCPHKPRPLMSVIPDCLIPADCRPLRLSRYLVPGLMVS